MLEKEGNPFSRIKQGIRDDGYNKDTFISIGKVIDGTLAIKVNEFELEQEDYILCKSAETIKANDKVLILQDGAFFYVIDKVV